MVFSEAFIGVAWRGAHTVCDRVVCAKPKLCAAGQTSAAPISLNSLFMNLCLILDGSRTFSVVKVL